MKHLLILITAIAFGTGSPATLAQSIDLEAEQQGKQPGESADAGNQQVSVGSQKRSAKSQVRNYIKEGNSLFNDKRYAEAEVSFKKALELDPSSLTAQYNLATTLLKNSGNTDPNDQQGPAAQAVKLYQDVIRMADNDPKLREMSLYNLGNFSYNREQYGESIELYKNVLRINPDNDRARQNLRLAQLKQQQQENQQQQQQQDQQQEQQDQQQQQQQQQQEQEKQQSQQPQMSDANAEKILKAMENEEAATRRKVEAQKAKEQQQQRRRTTKPW